MSISKLKANNLAVDYANFVKLDTLKDDVEVVATRMAIKAQTRITLKWELLMITTIADLNIGDHISIGGVHGRVTEVRRYRTETGITFVKTYGDRADLDRICNDWIILNNDGTISGNLVKPDNFKIETL